MKGQQFISEIRNVDYKTNCDQSREDTWPNDNLQWSRNRSALLNI